MTDPVLLGLLGIAAMWGGAIGVLLICVFRFTRDPDTYDPPEWATPVLIRHDDFTVDLEWREWLPGSPEMTE